MKKVNAHYLKTFLDKSKGLMFEKKPYPVFFQTRFGIHTFFMIKPIGVVILDNSFRIQKVFTAYPWRIYFWNPKHANILELPVSMLLSQEFKIGKTVKIIRTRRIKS